MDQEGKTWTIYKLISPSKKVYIGITSQKPVSYRWKNGKGYDENTKIGQAINKYGWDKFQHEIIEENIISLEEAKNIYTSVVYVVLPLSYLPSAL